MDIKPAIPEETIQNWQRIVDLMAKLTDTPAGLIMRLAPTKTINVFVASNTEGNVWKKGDHCSFDPGVYCESVIRHGDPLFVPDALKDPDWCDNPDMKFEMSFYLGYPLLWPDGKAFGTICVLDTSSDNNAIQCKDLIAQFKKIVESDLNLLVEVAERKQAQAQLMEIQRELENRVKRRTRRLEEVNTALKVLLKEHEETKKELESSMLVNINELIIPNLHRAMKCNDTNKQDHYLDLVESGLMEITSSFSIELVQHFANLTPAEIQIINLIRQGKRTKEIASHLHTATSTVDYHRANIRKKMGLSNSSTSLNTHLNTTLA